MSDRCVWQVHSNHTLLTVTVDLRNMRARELIQNALSRNREELRLRRRRASAAPKSP